MATAHSPATGPAAAQGINSSTLGNDNGSSQHQHQHVNGQAQSGNGNGNMSADGTPTASGAATPASTRGEAAVSMAKAPGSAAAKSSMPINFGTVQDQNAAMSSSPAGPNTQMTGAPTKFGSVAADSSKPKDKVIGFAGRGDGAGPRQLDFNKMFQGGGGSSSVSKPANGSATPASSDVTSNAASPSGVRPPPPNAVRPPNVARPFDPQRLPSQGGNGPQNSFGQRQLSGNQAAFVPQHNQQPRSPNMGQAHMQPMQHQMNGPPQNWYQQQQQQQHMHYMMGYGYPGMPQGVPPHMAQQWGQPQPGYDMNQGQTRSPRHMPANAMSNNGGAPGTPSQASAGVGSPAASQRSVPQTPNMASPAQSQPSGRPPNFNPSAASFSHSPSHSFSGGMSAAAQNFEPGKSRAIAIVNPKTNQAVEFKGTPTKSTGTPGTSTPGNATPATGTPLQSNAQAAAPAPAAAPSPKPAPAQSPAPVSPSPAPRKAPTQAGTSKVETNEDFQRRVHEAAMAAKKQKEEKAAAAAAAAAGGDEAARKAKEEEAAKKAKDDEAAAAAKKVAEKEEQSRRAEEEAAAKRKAEEAAEAERKAKDEADAKARAQEAAVPATPKKSALEVGDNAAADASSTLRKAPGTIDTSSKELRPAMPTTPSFRGSSADVERMAREASSIPSTPLEGAPPRLPPTPRTPGTPGFANLPAKPISSMPSANGITLDASAVERRRKSAAGQSGPSTVAQAAPSTPAQSTPPAEKVADKSAEEDTSSSSQASALGNARFIDDITKVSYPDKISSPAPELNASAEPGKFRYDRDFLMQFMEVYKEKPADLPPLAQIGMDSSQALAPRGAAGRRTSGMGPPAPPGRNGVGLGLGGFGKGGMGSFSHPPKTSEERFAASQAARGGAFGSSGPMGSFNAGARTQPLSRGGSGGSVPTREAMGTGVPAGGRTASRRGKDRRDGSRPAASNLTIPLDQIVPLELSENRWVGNRGANIKADSPEMVTRKVKSLLNKLTLERFDSISTQILEWANKSRDETDGQTLRIVIALIFEKATDEAAWSEMYATLCRKLMEKLDPTVQDESIKTNDAKPVVGGQLFRKYLLNRCQEDFENGWAARDATAAAAKNKEAEDNAKRAQNEKDEAATKEAIERGEKPAEEKEAAMLSDEYYEAQKAKRRGLGLVRFIGELYKLGLITEKIMHLCVQRLLSNTQTPEEEEVESLCKLLTTVGKLLDEGKARNYVDVYFTRMDEMMKNAAMTSRMKFMLQDLIELRQAQWRPRHDTTPKTIAEIHADAAKAKAQAEMDRHRSFAGGSMSRGGSRRGQTRDQFGADGFITVGNQPPAPAHQSKAGNLSAFGKGIDRGGTSRPLSVGPQSVFARKNQKSEDGSNPPSRTASSQNIFSLLSSSNQDNEPAQGAGEDASSGRPKLNLSKRTKPLPGQEGADDEEGKDEGQAEDEASTSGVKDLSDEEAKRRIDNDIKEFLEIKNVDEGKMAFESLPSTRRAEFIDKITETVLNRKESDVKLVGSLLSLARDESLLDDEMVEQGFKNHLEFLDDISIDVPSAYTFMAILLVSSELPEEKIEALAATIQGEGIKPPKDKLMAKVLEQQQASQAQE